MDSRSKKLEFAAWKSSTNRQHFFQLVQHQLLHLYKENLIIHSVYITNKLPNWQHKSSGILGGFTQQGIGDNGSSQRTERFLHREVLWGKSSLQSLEINSDQGIHGDAPEDRKWWTGSSSEWANKTGSPLCPRGRGSLLPDFMLTISF